MIEKIYFYRKFTGSEFILSKSEKTVIPVRLKNQFIPDSFIFDAQKKSWQKAAVLPEETEILQPAEFVEFPLKPHSPCFLPVSKDSPVDIEDLSPAEMTNYYVYRKDQCRYLVNSNYYNDSNKICKDFFSAEIETDYEKLILRLSFTRFIHPEITSNKTPQPDSNLSLSIYSEVPSHPPLTSTDTFIFDMNKGLFSSNALKPNKDDIYEDTGEATEDYQKFQKLLSSLKQLELKTYPKAVLCEAYKKLCSLAQKYTGLKNVPTASDPLSKMKKNEDARFLSEMYILTKLPCEPKLYGILMNQEVHELKIHFRYKRKDTKVLNKFLHKAHIKNYRILKKEYAENPLSLLTFRRLKDAGFRDLNLYNKVIQNQDFLEEINNAPRKALIFFLRYSLKHRSEIATLNTFLKTKDGFNNNENAEVMDFYLDKYDAMEMFQKYFRHIPKQLRKDILKDGFTTFNHDALANLTYRVKNKKITFKYSQMQQALEDDIDGYSFRLPQNSFQLCEIGTVLHNCVASYAENISKNESTIIYVTKEDRYQLCIEVQGNEIVQERADRNAAPSSEEKLLLQKWHERHSLKTNC